MSEENYLELLSILDPVLKKQDTVLRQSISSHERFRFDGNAEVFGNMTQLWGFKIIN